MEKQEYLETKIKPIIESLVFQLVCDRPSNPVHFMIDWLQKTGGFNPNGLTDEENDELNALKEEMKKYENNSQN